MAQAFHSAAAEAAATLGTEELRRLARAVARGQSVVHGAPEAARRLLAAPLAEGVPAQIAAAYLRGVADGYDHRAARVHAELVWTGPAAFDVPVRATAAVLTGLVEEAQHELILTTYSARPHPRLHAALRAATGRGVHIWIVVETLQGAGSALQGDQPAKAFADLPAAELWTWPADRRPEGAKMHAKLAVVDEQTLLVTSANLTTSGIDNNIEAGLLVRGGTAPRRAAEHLRALRRDGLLVRL